MKKARRQSKGLGDIVTITIRFTKSQWKQVHLLSLNEGASIQTLAIEGLSIILKKKGMTEL